MKLRYLHSRSLPCSSAVRVLVLVALVVFAVSLAPTGGLTAPGQPPGSTEHQVRHADPDAVDGVLARTVSFAATVLLAPWVWRSSGLAPAEVWEVAWRWVVDRIVQIVVAEGGVIHYSGQPPRI